jgi:competence protein ComEA
MTIGRNINGWTLVIILLAVVIIVGVILIWSGYSQNQAIEITVVPEREVNGEIYIGGEVNNPGFYPLAAGESVEDALRAAGGATGGADLTHLRLLVPNTNEAAEPQKVNINRAEAWLLETLPGIGESRARAIIEYRRLNGPFYHTDELVNIEGIGTATYEKIKHLITVAD